MKEKDPNPVRSALIPVVAFLVGRGIACCIEAGRLTSESRDRPLNFRERLSMRIHLRLCRECANYANHLEILGKISRETRTLPPLPAEAKRRLADALREDEGRK